jgi:hypothetical protein
MKYTFLFILLTFDVYAVSIADSISGKVATVDGCSNKVMVWLSLDKEDYKERLLLIHTEVPVGGSFEFFVKPGKYQVRASDKKGCEFLKKVEVKTHNSEVNVQMVKK